jgi:hypothetical protein
MPEPTNYIELFRDALGVASLLTITASGIAMCIFGTYVILGAMLAVGGLGICLNWYIGSKWNYTRRPPMGA